MNKLAIIIPALNAAPALPATLAAVVGAAERLVVDGGSTDGTAEAARAGGASVMSAPRGRGVQLAVGVAATRAPWLLLLHADTVLAPGWETAAARFMGDPACAERAGYFRFALASAHPAARRLERRVAWRCRALRLPYGDQGLLIGRGFLRAVGGVRPLPIMEDVDLARRIGRRRLVALEAAAVTSAARWERDGWRLRSLRNLCCLMLYGAGVPPRIIARLYS